MLCVDICMPFIYDILRSSLVYRPGLSMPIFDLHMSRPVVLYMTFNDLHMSIVPKFVACDII